MSIIQFINHACILIETKDHVLLIDPWLEGTAFYDGWALLDRSTSNAALVQSLRHKDKPVSIWYSHEHSDHFSIGCLKALQQPGLPNVQIIYQRTLDRRVLRHLQTFGWEVVELSAGTTLTLGASMSISVWPFFDTGDSYALICAGGINILNVNDCLIDTPQKCDHIVSSIGGSACRVDLLLTQFGYANWIGNESDIQLRHQAATEKLERIALQIRSMDPGSVIPFASFVYFCHEENEYLNDAQNTVDRLLVDSVLEPFKDRLCVLKPGDQLELNNLPDKAARQVLSTAAALHWRSLQEERKDTLQSAATPVAVEKLGAAATGFAASISRNLLWFNWLLEVVGVLRPVKIHLTDIEKYCTLSYVHGLRESAGHEAQLHCTSEVLLFILKNDFGFNTTLVNGRFRTTDMAGYRRIWRFFILQDLKKMGFGVSSPITSLLLILRNLRKFVVRKIA